MKALKKMADWLVFLMTGKGKVTDEAVSDGIVDLGGQGRDKYGK